MTPLRSLWVDLRILIQADGFGRVKSGPLMFGRKNGKTYVVIGRSAAPLIPGSRTAHRIEAGPRVSHRQKAS
jgi:hypothetical protein